MSLTIDEGYFDAKVTASSDDDHGACKIYTLDNGDSVVIYLTKPELISFHQESETGEL
jgi:hypothetical protein